MKSVRTQKCRNKVVFMLKYDEQRFKNICTRGDYNQVVVYLSGLEDGKELLEKYKDIYENGAYFIKTKDERIGKFLRIYEDYLKWALSNEVTTEECKEYIVNKLKGFFPRIKFYSVFSETFAWRALCFSVNRYFKKRGYFVTFGVTAPYPCLYLWGKETVRKEMVELPEGTAEIDVREMDETVTKGWLDYLSMNKVGAGGWVTKKGSNYFKDKYDTDSDEFKISLLKHEGQHFFDLKRHPKMKGTDLEYRAKLVELIYHKDMGTFFSFIERMAEEDDRTQPHAYANRKIVQAMSERIFGYEMEKSHDLWADKGEEIPQAARKLLKEHSEKMNDWDGKSFVV